MRRIALLASALTLVLTMAGCGDDEPDPAATSSATPGSSEPNEQGTRTIEITLEGDEAPPVERVQVDAGETIELLVTSDQPGELHVHSSPEQTLEYGAGETTLPLTIDQPGIVEVERHDPEALLLQLEVR